VSEIRLQSLSFRYPGNETDTLANLTLEIARGEAHALLGGSGVGKSTLLNLLSGLLPADAGQIFFDDRDVSGLNPWQRGVSQVFQFPVFYEDMTVAENLAFPVRRLNRRDRRQRVAEVARRLGISDLLSRRPGSLSLVHKQLAAIGKSLVSPDVSLVLLDEPLTAAEPEYKWQLRRALKSLQADLGATMIYVTHDQAEALTFADRVTVLHDARALQTGSPRVLVEEPDHEHVGYFVGSPGMNFLAGRVDAGLCTVADRWVVAMAVVDGPCRVGFRPEWGRISMGSPAAAALPVQIRGTRMLGVRRGRPVGLVMASLAGTGDEVEIVTRQALTGIAEGPGTLELDDRKILCFRDGWRVVA
jgi:glycerol transport system ATP-binding protein